MVKQLILILSLTRKDGRPTANLFDLWQQKSVSTEIAYYSELRQYIQADSLTLFQSRKAEYAQWYNK